MKDRVKRILSHHQGRSSAITRRELRRLLELDIKEDRALRLTIAELRREGVPILSSSSHQGGYYLPASKKELEDCLAEFRSRLIEDAKTRRDLKLHGNYYLAGEKQGVLI